MSTILLLGMGPTALSALDALAERFTIGGVVRDADPQGDDPVAARARALGAPLYDDVAPAAVEALVADLRPDCVVVSSYNRVLGAGLLARTRFVNVHYAPLPQYRGRANVNWAIINGEAAAAISVHTIAPGLDAGNILYQEALPLGPRDTVGELYERLNGLQRRRLGEAVARHLAGDPGEPQDEAGASYGCTRVPADGEIDWAAPTARVDALIRALAPPYPAAHSFLDGRRLELLRAEPLDDAPRYVGRVPGRVVGRSKAAGAADVLTGDGVLRIYTVRRPGGPALPAAELITSTRQTLGLRASALLDRIEALEHQLTRLLAAKE